MTKEQKARLGVFLLASFFLFVLILAILLIPKLKEEGDLYFINFKNTSVGGIFIGSPVKYQGVDIGKVTGIRVNPNDLNSILVDTKIRKGFSVKKDMRATLMYTGITGLRSVELSGGENASENLEPNGEIQTGRGLGEKAEDIVSNIDSAVKSINVFLSPENQQKISLFLENAEKSSGILTSVLESRKATLENSVTNIEKASLDFGRVTENLLQITDNLGKITGTLETGTEGALANLSKRFSDEEMGEVLKNLETFIVAATSSLAKIENVLISQQEGLSTMLKTLGEALENLSRFSKELTEDPTVFLRGRKEKKK